jgi:hypothetical protein
VALSISILPLPYVCSSNFCFLSLRLNFSTPCETPIVHSKFVFKPCNDEVQCPSRLSCPFFTAESCFCKCHFQAMRWCVLQAVTSERRSILILNCQVAMRTIVFARYEGQLYMRILRPSAQHTLISQLEQSLSPRSYPSLSLRPQQLLPTQCKYCLW